MAMLHLMTLLFLHLGSTSDNVHGFATHDSELEMYNLMLWNFSDKPVVVNLNLTDIPKVMSMRQTKLDAVGPGILENQRLRPGTVASLKEGNHTHSLELKPWAVQYWSIY
jgi:xylan 1,4-beta-xylosidase